VLRVVELAIGHDTGRGSLLHQLALGESLIEIAQKTECNLGFSGANRVLGPLQQCKLDSE
jgi:low temperature requirement protein LtrA